MSASSAAQLKRAIDALGNPDDARELQRFFKSGPGQYGEGDVFVGVKIPPLRLLAGEHRDLSLKELDKLLKSKVHEHRSAALIILTERAKRADRSEGKELYDFYLARTDRVTNWDLVDISCRAVVGGYLLATGNVEPLRKLARSTLLWDRRIAMVSTWQFIRAGQLDPTFEIATMLLGDQQDLMHKAVGWMLREAGKKDEAALEQYLAEYAPQLPRTALRYSIERMTPERRTYWRSRK